MYSNTGITLLRTYGKKVTIGDLIVMGEPFIKTGELPYNNNERNISCVPEGVYTCEKVWSPKFSPGIKKIAPELPSDKLWCLQNVEGRSNILFHWGNFLQPGEDTRGCIITGLYADDINNDGVMDMKSSVLAFIKLMQKFSDAKKITLTITSKKTQNTIFNNLREI